MPPFIALAIAGAGIYAGYKWLTRELQRTAPDGERAPSDAEMRATDAADAGSRHMPKDLGTLEWDAASGVYKPRKETAG
ncbi:MAG: hypothetical protein ABL908_07885 [Hyphomicrobium sp.]